jgi:hypothetical protein
MKIHRKVGAVLLAACFAGATPALGETGPAAPTPGPVVAPAAPVYSIVRWDEDYSYLKDPANRSDTFDPIKYIPLGGESYLSLGGSARYRYEYFNNNNFGAGPQDNDGYHLTRFLAHADLHLNPNLRFFVQGKSAMEDSRTGGPRASDADELDLQQGFGDLVLPFGEKSSATVRAGRQELSYGAQRLIGPLDWANVMRTFEGAKLMVDMPGDKLDIFWVRPVTIDKEEFNDGDGSASLAGVYNTTPIPKFLPGAGTKLELYALALNRADPAGNDADLYTLGTRLTAAPRPWDFDVEADYQFGRFADEVVNAYGLAIEGGYTFADVTPSPRPFVGFDIASGSPDGSERFNQLFPTGHLHFGYIDVIGRQNIIDLHPGIVLKLAKSVTLRAEDHFFWRQNVNDAVYNAAGGVLRADSGSNASSIGNEVDFTLAWQIDRHLSALAGYSHFFTGDFIAQTGANRDIDFFYLGLSYVF